MLVEQDLSPCILNVSISGKLHSELGSIHFYQFQFMCIYQGSIPIQFNVLTKSINSNSIHFI